MNRFNNPLDHVRIAAPCKADWELMIGTDRVRFCGQCNLNVYNLSSMTKAQAESLIAQTEGRLCVRFYRRKDGSILTDNCPVGLRAARRRLSSLAKAASAALLSFFAGLGVREVAKSALPTTPRMGVMVEKGPFPMKDYQELGMRPPGPMVVGELMPLQNLAERKARRRGDRSRMAPTK